MLKQLRVQNFKGWKDTGSIHLAPITLFFGANSSGKSSIGQFLMMLKQTIESSDRKTVFYLGGKNSAAQLGSYKEMVFHRDPQNNISFEYRWRFNETLKIKDPISEKFSTGDEMSFNAEVGLGEKTQNLLRVNDIRYHLFGSEDNETLSIGMERRSETKSDYKAISNKYSLIRKPGRAWPAGPPVRFYGFPDEVVAYYKNADFVQQLNLRHENLFRSIYYLGPLRTKVDRLYSWTGSEPESVGYSGENTIAAILAARNRKISYGYKRPVKLFHQVIAEKIREMGLIEDFKVNQISAQRQEYEVKVRTRGSADWVDLPDVGFGISQVLPVIVQCFYAPHNSIIIMEQPEIHLHPSAQASLADVIIDVITSRENNIDRNIQLIIETHSEHFLRRLQRRIAERSDIQKKVSVYFANIAKSPATLESLQIDMFGCIQNWPENFFGDDIGDITEQAKAAMKKKASQIKSKSDT